MKFSIRKNLILGFAFVIICSKCLSQETKQEAQKPSAQVTELLLETKDRRANSKYVALLNYSPLDCLIPSKIGLTLGLVNGTEQTWELEYLKGSVSVPFVIEDLGKMTDERISLIGRLKRDSKLRKRPVSFTQTSKKDSFALKLITVMIYSL